MYDVLFRHDTLKYGFPQGSVLGLLLYIHLIYINDLSLTINFISLPILFAYVTTVIISSRYFEDFCSLSNLVLSYTIKMFATNNIVLNLDKNNIMEFTTNNNQSLHYLFVVKKSIQQRREIQNFLFSSITNKMQRYTIYLFL